MAEEFNLDGMVDIYIYENGQLLENLEEIVLETKDDDHHDGMHLTRTVSMRSFESCTRSKALRES